MLPLPLLASDPTAVEPLLPVCWVRETLVRTGTGEESHLDFPSLFPEVKGEL